MQDSWQNKALIGYISVLGYCIATALSFALVHHLNQQLPVYFNVFATFSITTLVAIIVSIRSMPAISRLAAGHWKQTCIINLVTAGIWIFGFLALNRLPAWLYAIAFIGLKPAATYIYALILGDSEQLPASKQEKIILFITVGLAVLLMHIAIDRYSQLNFRDLLIGGVYALAAISCGSIYMTISEQYQKTTHMPPMHILSIRFFGTIGLCTIIVSWQGQWFIPDYWLCLKLISLALLTSLIPLLFLQMSIQNLGAITSAYFFPLILMLAYMLDVNLGYLTWNWLHFGLVTLLTLLLGYLIWVRYAQS